MSILSQCAPSRYADFLNISEDEILFPEGNQLDLFVGKNQQVKIALYPGAESRVRDIVVLGKLIIESSEVKAAGSNNVTRPVLNARDIFVVGTFQCEAIEIKGRNLQIFANENQFKVELYDYFFKALRWQRSIVEEMGLKSALY